jgi:polyhydroxyalkanoate synthesis regulator phasin
MVRLLRTGVLIALGLSWKTKETLDELVKKGEENPSEAAKRMRDLADAAERNGKEIQERLLRLWEEGMKRVSLPTRADIERLDREIAALAARLDQRR